MQNSEGRCIYPSLVWVKELFLSQIDLPGDNMAYFELNATSEQDFDNKFTALLLAIHTQKPKLAEIRDLESYFEFIQSFDKETGTSRPIGITTKGTVDPEHIKTLRDREYPEAFIHWAEKYGQHTCWIESITMSSVKDSLNEADGYYSLLPANNYQIFASDGSGNMYAFDNNQPGNPIRFFDHNNYVSIDSIEDLYCEVYDFYENEDGTLNNSNDLDPSAIFDEEGNYLANSIYIRKYLLDREVSRPVAENELLPFLLSRTLKGFRYIVSRFAHKIDAISNHLILSGKPADGIACYTLLLETDPERALFYNNRACLYRLTKQPDLAAKDAEKAISMNETEGLYYGTLAEALSDIDDHDGFFRNLELAVKNGMGVEELEYAIKEKYRNDPRYRALTAKS